MCLVVFVVFEIYMVFVRVVVFYYKLYVLYVCCVQFYFFVFCLKLCYVTCCTSVLHLVAAKNLIKLMVFGVCRQACYILYICVTCGVFV